MCRSPCNTHHPQPAPRTAPVPPRAARRWTSPCQHLAQGLLNAVRPQTFAAPYQPALESFL